MAEILFAEGSDDEKVLKILARPRWAPKAASKTKDITGGLPRVAELF